MRTSDDALRVLYTRGSGALNCLLGELQDYMVHRHKRGLRRPCFAVCAMRDPIFERCCDRKENGEEAETKKGQHKYSEGERASEWQENLPVNDRNKGSEGSLMLWTAKTFLSKNRCIDVPQNRR